MLPAIKLDSEDDEEYCYYEDITQHAKEYKKDDTPFTPVIPLSEVQHLVRDSHNTEILDNPDIPKEQENPNEEIKEPKNPTPVKRKRSNAAARMSPVKKFKDDHCLYPPVPQPEYFQKPSSTLLSSYNTYPSFYPQQMEHHMRERQHQPNECENCQNIQKSVWYCQKKITHLLYFFSHKQLQELARQRDMYLQLVIQNLMLSKDKQFKSKNYWLLFGFADFRDRALSQYPTLPKYDVPFIKHPVTGSPMSFSPQLSIFQSPLLDLSQSIYKRLLQDHNAEGVRTFLQKCALINNKLLPITKNSINGSISRRKFTLVDDYLLLIGLEEFGYKEIQNVQKKWLAEKNVKEIKHRYKNLTCCKANENIIKTWKKADEQKLSKEENEELWKGFSWFGSVNKIPLIVKYFLPSRSYRVVIRETQKLLNEGKKPDAKPAEDNLANKEKPKSPEETKGNNGKAGSKEYPSITDYMKAYQTGADHYVWEQLSIETGNDDEWASGCKMILPDVPAPEHV